MKNSRLIYAMSLPQRIKLITSTEAFKSNALDGYEFPPIEFLSDPLDGKDVRATDFPTDITLECAFSPNITAAVYKCKGNEAKGAVPYAYYNVGNRAENDFEKESFITAQAVANKIAGLNGARAFVNYDDVSTETDTANEKVDFRLITDIVERTGEPDSVLIRSSADARHYDAYKSGSLMFGVADSKEDVARFLQKGYSFVFLNSDFTEELIPYLISLTDEYKKAVEACARGKITPEKIEMCLSELAMLPEERINEACDAVIERLISLSNNNVNAVRERLISLDGSTAKFNEPQHDAVALEAARQSVVMLRNDGILPLEHEKKVAVLGEYAKNKAYHEWGNKSTAPYLPFEVINDFEIETVGFAYGYRAGEAPYGDLWNTAKRLCNKADVTVVFLGARKGERVLPTEQLALIDALHGNGTKFIAVVACDGLIDMSFVDKCNAVLLTHRGGQKSAHAVFEIITGFITPSGSLPYSVPMTVGADGTESGGLRYPLGYGLRYTEFSYDKLSITDAGVSLTVRNDGNRDGFSTVVMHIKRQSSGDGRQSERRLRGFAKVFVPAHGTEKVEIPFGEETFRSYDFAKKQYCVEGGVYAVTVGETEEDPILCGEITVRGYVFNDEKTYSGRIDNGRDGLSSIREFADTDDKREFYMRQATAPAGARIFAALLMALYFDISMALLIGFEILPNSIIVYIPIIVLLAVANVAAIVYCLKAVRRHKELENAYVPIADDSVEKLGLFKELAFVSYETPIPQEDLEEEEEKKEEEEKAEEEEAEEVPVYEYDTGFIEGTKQNIAFKNSISFAEICSNFRDYMLAHGIDVALSSIRALFAAIASSKIVFVQVNHKDILPAFQMALGDYFQGAEIIEASPSWRYPNDLFWTRKDNRFVASGFVRSLYSAQYTPDKNAIAILNNVHVENLRDWFSDIIKFALFPSERHIIKFNDDTQAEMPHNLCYLLFTENDKELIPADIAAASVQIHIGMSVAEKDGELVEIKPVSLRAFEDLVREAREEYFLSEIIWKKLDEMCETISARERFGFGNKVILQMEKFSSVLLASGGDAEETFSKMFTAKIVALLKNLVIYQEDKGDKFIFDIIEKLFADENLIKIRKALMKTSSTAGSSNAKSSETKATEAKSKGKAANKEAT